MPMTTMFKHLTLRVLPASLLQPLRKAHYSRKLAHDPGEPEMAVIPHLLPPGGCALDIGANFGLYTRFLSETVGPAGIVHAIEPVPETFEVLESNVQRLRLTNVTAHNLAISDRSGEVNMHVPRYARGGENYYEARIIPESCGDAGRHVCVAANSLDDRFARLGRIDFIKCDVEGHELQVISGAHEVLRIHRPAWLLEISGDPENPESPAAEVVRIMTRAGYRMYNLDAARRTPNRFFLRPEHVRRLAAHSS